MFCFLIWNLLDLYYFMTYRVKLAFFTSPYVIRNRSSSLGPAKNRRVIFSIDYKLCYNLCDRGNKSFEALLHF